MPELWDQRIGAVPLFSQRVRPHFARLNRWVRFHSLPKSKRYPDTPAEMSIVLDRANTLVHTLADNRQPLVVLTTQFSTDLPQPTSGRGGVPWRVVVDDDYLAEGARACIYGESLIWQHGAIDDLIRAVALDEIANVMLVPHSCDWIAAPYDGGIDIVAPNRAIRDALRAQFAAWLPANPDGL